MDKPAVAEHPILDLLSRRWSPRAFADRPVEAEILRTLFEAARWAPSSFNEQPWRFIVATREDPDDYAKLLSCLVEWNRQWAQGAPVLLLSTASSSFAKNGKANPHGWHDVGLAMMSLAVQATELGIHLHQMAGFDSERARQLYVIPAGFDPVAMAAIGYLGDPEQLPKALRDLEGQPRTRKPLADLVFSERFGLPAPIVSE
jgi:nitroreductase